MTIMLGKVYAALKAAGAPEEQAMAAAEEMGDMREEFGGLRSAMHEMHADVKGESGGLRSDFRSELSGLRSDFRGEFAGVRSEVAFLRGRFDVLMPRRPLPSWACCCGTDGSPDPGARTGAGKKDFQHGGHARATVSHGALSNALHAQRRSLPP
jgi:hypothetical protein